MVCFRVGGVVLGRVGVSPPGVGVSYAAGNSRLQGHSVSACIVLHADSREVNLLGFSLCGVAKIIYDKKTRAAAQVDDLIQTLPGCSRSKKKEAGQGRGRARCPAG